MNKFLEIKNLNFGYEQNNFVLKNINFDILQGEFLGIIGPNGAGKTTLLKSIARILFPQSGIIMLQNKNIFNYDLIDYAKKVSFATKITDYSLKYSVKDFLSLARYPFLKTKYEECRIELIQDIAGKFELSNFLSKHLNELSAGELQRVIVAQSLLQTPELLLLDEPTSHLDISQQIKILDFIKKINLEKKISIISIFHDLNLASEYCDKIILLSEGEIKKFGNCCDVMDYKILEETYKTMVVITENPISKKPYVFPVPFMWKKEK